jgi:hypothetical protein
MQRSRIKLLVCSLLAAGAIAALSPAVAQDIISAVGGMIYHSDGPFQIGDKEVTVDPGRPPQLKKGEKLETGDSRVEVMLVTSGFVRLAAGSSMEMILAGSDSARFRLHKGSAVVDLKDVWDEESVSAVAGDVEVMFRKRGLYRIDASEGEPPTVKVFRGKARVEVPGGRTDVGGKKMVTVSAADVKPAAVKFDPAETDSLDEWNRARDQLVAQKRKEAITAMKAGEGDNAEQILLKQGSPMWGCRQLGIGCGQQRAGGMQPGGGGGGPRGAPSGQQPRAPGGGGAGGQPRR